MSIEVTEIEPFGYAKTEQYPHGAPASQAGVAAQYSDYEHYAGMPSRQEHHERVSWMISSVFDVCVIYCECGKWAARASLYKHSVREVQPYLRVAHNAHQHGAGNGEKHGG